MVTQRFFVLLSFAAVALASPATTPPKFAIVHAGLHAGEDGPAVPKDYRFIPGETVYFAFQVQGYTKSEEEKIDLAYEIQATDPKLLLIVPPENGAVATSVSHEDKDWQPKVRWSFNVPPFADSGDYKISVKLKDNLAGNDASDSLTFHVEGVPVEPSTKLVIRNFRFLRSEEDKDPLKVAAYRPGDTLWARFEMTGYNVGPGNSFDVEYGLSILRADGSVAYTQPHAAGEKQATFYPQRYTPGAVSLNIPPDLKKGDYTMIITARDVIGEQTAEVKQNFSVE
ncbi:MAG TPA: hypothetical protein VKU01_32865 [Bryobacteraceae bacterium]|nr:hypothetical protein [Bryobacteraceae bacterium]